MEDIIKFAAQYRFLSNFWELKTPVVFDTTNYYTVEAAYVSAKTINLRLRFEISQMNPFKAKEFGKTIIEKKLSINPEWTDTFRIRLMKDLVSQKFSKNEELAEKLIKTGEVKIIEGNTWHDNFFGICICRKCSLERKKGEQYNHLGIILMEVREKLRV